MPTTWVIAADASRARIFRMPDRNRDLEEIGDFVHQASRAKDRDLITDAQGRYFGGELGMGHSAPSRTDPTEYEADRFSKQLSDYVEKARTQHEFDNLCLIAPPKFLGMMRQNLSREAQKLINKEIPKDISWFNPRDIETYIKGTNERPA